MAIIAAFSLILGVGLVFWYTSTAETRAMSSMSPTSVYVVQTTIPAGTSAKDLGDAVKLTQLPAVAVQQGAITNLQVLGDKVTAAVLNPGEQVTSARFVNQGDLGGGGTVALPDGMSELSLRLDIQNAAGGTLQAGDEVGIYLTVMKQTSKVATKALVLRVASNPQQKSQVTGSQMIVLAVTPELAIRLVHSPSGVWLTRETDKSSTSVPSTVTDSNATGGNAAPTTTR